jgi:hypothetical protein
VPSQRIAKASEPDAVAGGLDHRQRDGGGDGRVDGVAAARQHRKPGLRGKRLRGGDDVVAATAERREG